MCDEPVGDFATDISVRVDVQSKISEKFDHLTAVDVETRRQFTDLQMTGGSGGFGNVLESHLFEHYLFELGSIGLWQLRHNFCPGALREVRGSMDTHSPWAVHLSATAFLGGWYLSVGFADGLAPRIHIRQDCISQYSVPSIKGAPTTPGIPVNIHRNA